MKLSKRLADRPELGSLALLSVVLAVFASIYPDFLSPLIISNTLTFSVELGLNALAVTFLMTAGEYDLSVGSLFSFAPVIMWKVFIAESMSIEAAFLTSLSLAAVIGFANGMFVTALRIPSFFVTLGMLLVVRGAALYITDGFHQRTWLADGKVLEQLLVGSTIIGPFRFYVSLFWFVVVADVLHYGLRRRRASCSFCAAQEKLAYLRVHYPKHPPRDSGRRSDRCHASGIHDCRQHRRQSEQCGGCQKDYHER